MMINLSTLEQYRESNRLEAKKALGGLPHSIWETYSAFANTYGGLILLGVEEWPDRSLHPVDLPDPEGMVREFREKLRDPKMVSADILSEDDVRIEEADGCRIIVIDVPQAGRRDRPVYIFGDPYNGSYYRSGDGDFRFTREETEELLLAATEN